MKTFKTAQILALSVLGLLSSGCASNTALRAAINDRDAEIRELRDQRVRLNERIQALTHERDNLQVSIDDAAMRLTERPRAIESPVPSAAFPEFETLGIDYGMRDGRVVISLPSTISFGSGKADLSDQGAAALNAIAKRLKSEYAGATFHIEGHTDSDPISRSSFGSNRALSLARAMAVLEHLVEVAQVEDRRFVVAGHGEYLPIASNDTAQGKARNRRVEIIVHALE